MTDLLTIAEESTLAATPVEWRKTATEQKLEHFYSPELKVAVSVDVRWNGGRLASFTLYFSMTRCQLSVMSTDTSWRGDESHDAEEIERQAAMRLLRALEELEDRLPWDAMLAFPREAASSEAMEALAEELPEAAALSERLLGYFSPSLAMIATSIRRARATLINRRASDARKRVEKKLFDELPEGAVLICRGPNLIGIVSNQRGKRTKRTVFFPREFNNFRFYPGTSEDLDMHIRSGFRVLTPANAKYLSRELVSRHAELELIAKNRDLDERFAAIS